MKGLPRFFRVPRRPRPAERQDDVGFRGHVEELEPRILFSADAAGVLLGPDAMPAADLSGSIQQVLPPVAADSTQASQTAPTAAADVAATSVRATEIVFIDARVPDAQQLMSQILTQQSDEHTLEFHWLEADKDGVAQISDVLQGRQDIAALHLISHGSDGNVQLGNIWLNESTLPAHLGQLSGWQSALTSDADILIYGCDVAATAHGQHFIDDLSLLTGADVAASQDRTGAASLGGDWQLEYQAGFIDRQLYASAATAPDWNHELATAPSLDLDGNNSSGATGSNFNATFTEQTPINIADTDATVTAGTNAINTNVTSLTVTLTNRPDGTAESLSATTTGTNITSSYSTATGILTLTGSDTAANYQQVLRTIQYNNTSDNPTTTTRTINFVVSDPYGGSSATATTSLVVTRVNDAPVITSNGGGATASVSVRENTTAVTTATATDVDSTTLTYSISGADAAKFSINATSGVLTFASAPDFEAPTDADGNNIYEVIVQVSDGALTDTQAISVTVTDVSSALVVTTTADTNDSGLGTSFTAEQLNAANGGTDAKVSLREAIIAANNTPGTDTITFNISTGTVGIGADAGAYIITTTSALPTLTQAVYIDASTQTGYVAGGLHTVVLDGNGGSGEGLSLTGTADGTTIRGLVIRGYSANGIYVQAGSDNNTIVGNYIGSFYADGSNAGTTKRNASEGIESYGANLTIGGTTAADRNVISGNASAYNIYLGNGASGTVVTGNYLGTNAAGTSAFTSTNSTYGIMVENPVTNVVIGGTVSGAGNLVSGFTNAGIWLSSGGTNTVQGNYVGTDKTGTFALANGNRGIFVDEGSAIIGGTASGAGNVISGNTTNGIYANTAGSITVQGNIIGLNATGTAKLANGGAGIYLSTGTASIIGGNTASARNVISGNGGYGIDIESSPTGGHVVKGNYIGVAADGTTLLGNSLAGVYINATGVDIGGKTAGDGNVIAGNGGAGIAVAGGNGNLFYRNSIYSNTGLGIDLGNDGVTANDYNDGDGGANYSNNFPVITSVVTNGTTTTIQGSVEWYHGPDPVYIELFGSPTKDATGYGQGKVYLGAVQVTTNSDTGDATFSLTVSGVSVGDWVTAVANYEASAIGASEFAKAVQAVAPTSAPRGRVIWNNNDRFYQYYADWSAAGFGGTGVDGLALGDDLSMFAAAASPTRNEIIFVGSADVSGKVIAVVWNGDTNTWSTAISLPLSNPSATSSHYDSFAIAYDSISGDAMLLWDNGNTSTTGLSYATWNGTSWSSTGTITAPVSGEPLHMQIATKPASHEMTLVVQTSAASNNQYAIVWNGSSWGNAQTLGTNTNEQNFEINVAYEQLSGKAMVVYDNSASNSPNVQYRTWNGTSWSSEGTITAPSGINAISDLYSTAIASDRTSNRIAIAAKDANNEIWMAVWNGSSWGSTQVATTSGRAIPEDHATMAVAFESQSGDLLVAYGKSAGPNVYYRTWTSSGGWSGELTGPSIGGTDIPYIIKLYADPYSNTIMMGVQDNGEDLSMVAWDGSAWGSVSEMDSATGFSYRENFTYVWYQTSVQIANIAGDTLAYTEDQSAQVIDQGTAATVTMGNESLYNGGNLTVSIVAGGTSSEDVLGIRNQGMGAGQIGVSGGNVTYAGTTIGTYTGGTGDSSLVITFNANATNAAVTALIKNITYLNSNTATPSTSSRTVRFVATNSLGQGSGNHDATVTVAATNDAPTNTVPTGQTTNEDTSLVFSSGNGNLISIADVDAGSGSMQVTLAVTNGSLTLSGTSGLSFTTGDGTADTTMTFTGTVSAINTALAGMSYAPTANYNGSAQLTITTSDQGNTGTGGTLTDVNNVAITVTAVNDAPVNTVPAAQTTNEDTSLVFSSGNGNLISIADVDAGSGSMQVTLAVTNGSLTLSGTSGLSFTAGDGTADTTMTFTGTVSAINTALAGLSYAPTANYNGSAQLTITTSDQGNTGTGGAKSDTDNVNITVTAVNDAPVNTVPAAQTTNEDANLVFSAGNGNLISIADVDAGSGSMQVSLSVAHGTLTLSGTTGLSFTTGDGTADGTMVFTGTISAINSALSGLVYAPTGNYNGADTLTITTSDQGNTGGGAQTDVDNVAITVTAVNDAPVNTVPAAQTTNEDTSLVFSSGNGNLISIADVDAGSGAMQVTLTVTNGSLTLSGTSGLSFTAGDGSADATMTFTGTVSAINTALAGMSYAPTANYNGSAQLTITTSDQGNTGTGGTLTDVDNVAITVTAVNDAPVNTVPAAQTTNEDTSLVFSSGNGNLISIADVDAGSGSMQVTLAVTNGSLTLSGTSGLSFTAGDGTADTTMTFTGTVSAINTALAGMSYAPTANYNGSAQLTITTSDQGNTGTGGTLTDVDNVAITVTAVNDAPVNTVPAAQTTNEDTNLVFSSGNGNLISIADVDAGSGSMQVTLAVTNGSLTLSGTSGLSFTAGDGTADTTMTFTGTVSAINTALAGLSYAPTANYNGSAQLTITTSDQGNTGTGGAKSDTDNVNITVTAVNDAPVNTVPASQTTNEDTSLVFSSGNGNLISIADIDAGSGSMQVSLSVAHGTLTLSGTTGLSFTTGDGTADSTMVFTGTRSNINAALAGLSYTATANYNGSDSLSIITSDLGNTGTGGTLTDSDSVTITVNAVNDAPVATITPVTYNATEQTTLNLHGTGLSITDVDAGSSTIQATLTVTSGTLTVSAGATGVVVTGSASQTVTLSGTLSQINALLAGTNGATVSYIINSDAPPASDLLTLSASDLGNTGTGGVLTGTDTATIQITAVNDAPTVNITEPSYSVVEAQTLALHNTGLSVNDPDGTGTSVQVTVSVDIGVLTITAGTTGAGIAGSGTGSVTLTGTVAQINNLLSGNGGATIGFINNSGTPTASATLTLAIDDLGNTGGGNLSASANVAISVIPAASMGSIGIPGVQPTDIAAYYGFDSGSNLGRNDAAGGVNMTLIGTPTQDTGIDGRQSAIAIVNDTFIGGTQTGGTITGLTTGGAMTISTWVRFDAFNDGSGGWDRIIDFGQAGATGIGNIVMSLSATTHQVSFMLQHSGASQDVVTTAIGDVVQAGQWTQIAATVDSSGAMSIYFNGTLSGTFQGTALATGVRTNNFVGQSNDASAYGMNGAIDNLLVVNRAMNASEVAMLYNQASGFAVNEKSANGTVVGTVLDGPSVNGRTVTYSLVNSAGGRFAIDANTGLITVADQSHLLYSGASSHSITVRATDNVGDSLDTTYTVNLLNINDAPVGVSHTVTTLEDTAYTFGTADFGFSDPNDPSANALQAVKIVSLPTNGTLTLNGTAVSANDVIQASDIIAGKLQFTGDTDGHGTGYASFGFKVQDDGGTANGGVDTDVTTRTMTIDVTAVNDAPQGQDNTVTTLEDTPYVFNTADFGFSDVDGNNLLAVQITGLPTAGTLTLNGAAVSANDVITASDIASGLLVLTPATDAHGASYAAFTFKVQDDGGTVNGGVDLDATDRTMTVSVTSVNDAPAGTDGTITTLEDTAHVFTAGDFGFSDTQDSPADTLSAVKFSVLPSAGVLKLNGNALAVGDVVSIADINAGLLTFSPAANQNGAGYASIGFQVQDSGGTANGGIALDPTVRTLIIDVTAVNDAPATSNTSVSGNEDNAITGSVTGNDVDGDTLTFSKATDPSHGAVSVASDGSFTYTPLANYNGSDSFTVSVSDGHGGTAISTVSVTVNAVNDAPTANNPAVSGNEDTVITGSVTGSDVDGDTLTYAKATNAAHGSVTVASDGSFSYTPTANYNGSDSFTVTVSDGQGGTATSTVSITVNAVNDAPTASNIGVTGNEDNAITGQVVGADVDGDALTYAKASNPTHGTVNVAGDGSFTYTPTANYNGSDSFTVLVSDGHGSTVNATVSVTVNAVNDAPQADNPSVQGNEDTDINGAVVATDVDGDTLSYAKSTDPVHGSVVIHGDGSFTYTPTANYNGNDAFTVTVSDGQGGSVLSTVSVHVNAVNDVPAVNSPAVSGTEDQAIAGSITASDADGDALSYQVATDPAHGSVSVASDGSFVYTPATNFHGADSFTVLVSDGQGGQATSTISISVSAVNDAPTANNPAVNGNEDTVITGSVTGSDVDGDILTYTKATNAAHGSVTVAADGSFSYTPTANYNGSDSFTVTVSDGQGGTTTSTVSITVNAVNDAPTASNIGVSGNEDNTITGNVTGNDVDGDTLTFSKATDPSHGAVSMASDGSFTYTPLANYNGSDSFTVSVSDGHGGTAISTVSVTVNAVNDAPTANNPAVSGNEDTVITGSVTGSDVDGDTLTYTKATNAAHGSVTVAADGSFSYTPTANYNGSDSFTVTVSDGQGGTTTSTVSITVNAINDAPVASVPNTPYAATEQVTLNLAGTGLGVLDADAGANTVQATLAVTSGTLQASAGSTGVTVAGSGSGTLILIGTQDQINALLGGLQGATLSYTMAADAPPASDTLSLTIDDQGHAGAGGNLSASANVQIAITAVNDAPVMAPATLTANAAPSASWSTATLLAGAVDPDGTPLAVRIVQGPQHGSLSVSSNGQITYTTDSGYTGADGFSYEAYDGQTASAGTRVVTLQASSPTAVIVPVITPPSTDTGSGQGSTPSSTNTPATPTSSTSTSTSATSTNSATPQSVPLKPVPVETGEVGTSDGAATLQQRIQVASWTANRAGGDTGNSTHNGLFTPALTPYIGPTTADAANSSPVIQLLSLIQPTLDRLPDINLNITPLSGIPHVLPQRATSGTATAGEEAGGTPIRLAKVATYSTGLGLSIGTIWWTARISGLVTSALISTPAWRALDPLPVVTSPTDDEDDDEHDEHSHLGDREVEHLFDADRPIEQDLPVIQ